ncbi:amino acid ABC transporter substrate-binding protein [Halioglobus maricola]|uniref:Amino acid ABC transporter substrate-binding protein n=1 Tax=Halioglobus maricola TaxID=2601894 RepID=A0A5P9NPQ5_9GAMM|nr:ABC transporter substrate-binding protein [Halioglobus maricola]QFU77476.1 amino acid ABC transporter substrate-binding protein [Halioglobus maricola]
MKNLLARLLPGFAFLIALSIVPGATAGDSLQRVIDFKTLTVGTSGDQPPMTAVSRQGGVMGFDVDLAQGLAKAMRVQLDIQVLPFGELLDALEDGKIDMIMSNFSITPERSERAHFIGPYMMSGKSILTRNSVLANAQNSEDFNRADLKIAAVQNSTSAMFVAEVAPDATLVAVESSDLAIQMLLDGKVDALMADMAVCKLAVLRHRDAGLVTLQEPLTIEPVGIAVSLEDRQFQNLVSNYLNAYEKTGVLTKLRKKWFEQSDWIGALP